MKLKGPPSNARFGQCSPANEVGCKHSEDWLMDLALIWWTCQVNLN